MTLDESEVRSLMGTPEGVTDEEVLAMVEAKRAYRREEAMMDQMSYFLPEQLPWVDAFLGCPECPPIR